MVSLGQWISNQTAKPFYARYEFEVQQKIKTAQVKISGLGQFILSINGKKVGDHELDPGWTNYDKLVQYVAFDVTEKLVEGINVIGAEVGNGWYHMDRERYFMQMPPKNEALAFLPTNPNPYQPFSRYLALTAVLEIIYINGESKKIITDNHWKTSPHPVKLANVFGSEIYDARDVCGGWNRVSYDDQNWSAAVILKACDAPKGQLVPQTQPPIKVKRIYEAKFMYETEPGCCIYDLGQNMSGILELEICGKVGETLDIYPAEKLGTDGNIDQMAKGWTPIDTSMTYIVGKDDEWETWRMTFSFFAGRYLLIKGNPQVRHVRGLYMTSDSPDSGSFKCDDQRYEQIYDLVLKAVESNLLSVHMDCPTIERIAWQEQNHLMAPSIMYMKNVKELWEKIMLDLRTEQCSANEWYHTLDGGRMYPGEGMVPSQAPCYEHNVVPAPGIGSFFDTIPWGSSIILAVYWHYMFYGDISIVAENYEAGVKYLKYLKTKVTADGFINHGLGDWGNPRPGAFARENIETVFLYADVLVLSYFAEWLGKSDDRDAFAAYAKEVKDNYNQKLLVKHPTEGFYCYRAFDHPDEHYMTQACQAMPLYWGMVPEDKTDDVVKALDYILAADQTFVSGEIGLSYIIQTMRRYDMNDRISEFILKEQHPSYYAFVLAGETTLGEYWEDNPRSHNHDMMGHIVEWYYNGIAGIQPEEPGFEKITIRPYLPNGMKNFACTYNSVKGEIMVSVKEMKDAVELIWSVPNGVVYSIDTANLAKRGKKVMVRAGHE